MRLFMMTYNRNWGLRFPKDTIYLYFYRERYPRSLVSRRSVLLQLTKSGSLEAAEILATAPSIVEVDVQELKDIPTVI